MRAEENSRRLSMLRWGLIPAWAKDPNIGYKLINARSETASAKPAFRGAWRHRRCLIPADGFYEWTGREATRQPWLITMKDDSLFAFAGLWERWTVPEGLNLRGSLAELAPGDSLETCTILTTAANDAIRELHDRMPVILPREHFEALARRGERRARPLSGGRDEGRARQRPRQQARERRSALHRADRAPLRRQGGGECMEGSAVHALSGSESPKPVTTSPRWLSLPARLDERKYDGPVRADTNRHVCRERELANPRDPAARAASLKASQERKREGGLALSGARMMAKALNPGISEFLVRDIVAYSATRIFHAPMSWRDENADSWSRLPDSTLEYAATITGSLTLYLESGSALGQFAKDPGLRESVEKVEKRSGDHSTFLVVEEQGPIENCTMDQGECWLGPEEGRDAVVIFKASGGAWPEFSEKTERDTVLLAAMRTMTKKDHPFELHTRSVCFLTDQGETAHPLTMEMNIAYGAPRAIATIPDGAVAAWADQIAERVKLLRRASADPAVNELLSAIRLDKARDDEFFRLWYLRLWQALRDTGEFCASAAVKTHLGSLRHQGRWIDLTGHRNAIAHWETARVDYVKVADLHRFAVEVLDYIAAVAPKGRVR